MLELSLKRPLVVFVLFSIIGLLGFVSFKLLNLNLMPKFESNYLTISTIYPGASASEVETSVSKKVEDAVAALENLKQLKTYSSEGLSMVTIELESKADPNIAIQEAQRKINAILSQLPSDAKSPTITKLAMGEQPIMKIAATAEMPQLEFYKLIEDRIQPRLAKIEGVGKITMMGGEKREIEVSIDREKLQSYGLAITQVLGALKQSNQEFPTGKLQTESNEYTVRLAAKYTTLNEIRNTVVATGKNGATVKIGDVADVVDGTATIDKISRYNGISSIGLQVQKQSDANTVLISEKVRKEIESITKEYSDKKVKFEYAVDNADFTKASIYAVVEDLILAVIIVSFVCLMFLHSMRSALIVMVSVPLSMLPSFIGLYLLGYSLNIMSLMALSLAVGILVDDSIVVLENIFRHLEMGKNKYKAALEGGNQIILTAASITIVISVVFLPLIMSGGIIGQILKEFAVPMLIATMSSLLVSFTLTPLLLSKFGKVEDITGDSFGSKISRGIESIFEKIKLTYGAILKKGLNHKGIVFGAITALFIASVALLPAGFIGTAFIPDTDSNEFNIKVELAPESTLYETNKKVAEIEQYLFSKSEVIKVFTNVGFSSSMMGDQTKGNIADITVTIIDKSKRTYGVVEYARETGSELQKRLVGVKTTVAATSLSGSSSSAPIQYGVKSSDPEKLEKTASMLMDIMKKTPGAVDVKYVVDDPRPEITVDIDRTKMEQLGLSISDIGSTMRLALAGNTDSKYTSGPYEYEINVQFDKFNRKNVDDVSKLSFVTKTGATVELSNFAKVKQSVGPSMLERTDRIGSKAITSNVNGRPSGTVGAEIAQAFKGKIPEGVTIEAEGMLKAQGDAFSSLGYSFVAAIILIYLIMVALYNSLLHPIVVLFSIPVAIIGSLLALSLTMENLTIFSIIGLITLIGLVAKNAILLVDFTNHLRAEGKSIREALIEAGQERLRPILMTTFAMVFGMLPVAIASGAGAEIKNGMAWVIIGGLLTSLALTLVLVPAVYEFAENIKAKFTKSSETIEAEPQLESIDL